MPIRPISTSRPGSRSRSPALEDFARPNAPTIGRLAPVSLPGVHGDTESAVSPIARSRLAVERSFELLSEAFDVVVFDLPVGPTGPGRAIGGRLERLDWLVLAVTPEPNSVARRPRTSSRCSRPARHRGEIGDVRLAVLCTGDEGTAVFEPEEVETDPRDRDGRPGSPALGPGRAELGLRSGARDSRVGRRGLRHADGVSPRPRTPSGAADALSAHAPRSRPRVRCQLLKLPLAKPKVPRQDDTAVIPTTVFPILQGMPPPVPR